MRRAADGWPNANGRLQTDSPGCDMVWLGLPVRRSRSPTVANALPCCPCNVPGTMISTPVGQLDFLYFCCVGVLSRERLRAPKAATHRVAISKSAESCLFALIRCTYRHTKSIKRGLSCTDGIYPRKQQFSMDDLNAPKANPGEAARPIARGSEDRMQNDGHYSE